MQSFTVGKGKTARCFSLKKCMFAAAAAALASFHNLSSQRAQKGTVIATMTPDLSPPKYKWKI